MKNQADAIAELQRLKLMQDMQSELTAWAKSRLGWLSVSVAVLGFFGLSTVVNQAVQSLVAIPVQKQIEKLEIAKQKADDTTRELKYLSESVNKSGQDAMGAAGYALTKTREVEGKLAELQVLIGKARENIEAAERQSQIVVSKYETADRNISGVALRLFDKSRQQSVVEKFIVERIDGAEKKQSEIAAAVGEILSRDRASGLAARLASIEDEYRNAAGRLSKRNAANIVLMTGKGDGNEKTAKAAEKFLQTHGYYASVYYLSGASAGEKAEDFEKEFPGLKGAGERPVVYINESLTDEPFYRADIRAILDGNGLGEAAIVAAKFAPAGQYLRKSDEEAFDARNIIVCYFPVAAAG